MPIRNKIFVSYSHKDSKLFEEFEAMLAPVIKKGLVNLWNDRKIQTGAKWKDEIQEALASTRIAVLLVSRNFLASPFIANDELPPLLTAAEEEGVIIFWICLSSCLWQETEIGSYQAAHDISRPLDSLTKSKRQAVLSETCAKLVKITSVQGFPVKTMRELSAAELADMGKSSQRIDDTLGSENAQSSQVTQRPREQTAGGSPIRVLSVDDHPVVREGIAAILAHEPDMFVVAEAGNGREAIELFRTHRPDVTLMDLVMPIMSGMEAIAAIRAEFPNAGIIVLTSYREDMRALRALKAGAAGYVLKSMVRRELAEAIRSVHSGRKSIPAEVAVKIVEHQSDEALTEREIEVLRQIAAGNANKMIAGNLSISEQTVKAHVRNVLSKLGAIDRTHAVTIGLKRGIIEI